MKLKRILLILALIPIFNFAQSSSAAFKLGFFSPATTDAGFIIGYEGRKTVDRNLYVGWSLDWFHKSYVDQSIVNDLTNYGFPTETNELRAKTNLHEIPIMMSMTGEFPVARKIKAFATGGVGLETLLMFYNNFVDPNQDEFKAAFDFAWRLGGGIIYEIGSRSDVFAEFTFHSAKPSWNYEVEDASVGYKKTFERTFNMSGMLMRIGIRYFY